MAVSNRDTLTPIVQKAEALMVRNDRGHPGFTLTIDGKTVPAYETQTLLSVAIDNGITDIPNMCSDGELEPAATCRMCLVSIEGTNRLLPACSTMAQPGMIVTTKSDELFHLRRINLELILSDHNAYCQPPCQVDCPTHIDIPGYLELMARGAMKEAARLVKEVLPFPYILGLTCPAPCQKACRRTLVEEEIAICRMHGHAAETCLLDPPVPFLQDPPTGKQVAIVGAGPAGLTCAYYLALKGHACKVFDMQPQPGGMLRYGIPEYRLPKDVMDRELDHVFQLGVDLQNNVKLGRDFTIDDLFAQGFDAVYLAIGAWTSNPLDVPDEDADGVVNAITFLAGKVEGKPIPVKEGTEVVVLGGGFTAFDCTRTSLRLGAQVHTGYRRSAKEMTATPEEIEDAEAEGTALLYYVQQTRVITAHGSVTGLECVKTRLGEPDVSGRRIVPYKPVELKVKMPMLPYEDRTRNFRPIELGYLQEQAEREAARCLQCACPAAGQCDLQKYSIEFGLADNRFHDGEPSDYHDYETDLSHSFILRDPNKCINCTQCVRVCHDVIGPDCYGMFGKGFDTIVSTPFNVSLHDTDCVSCGACVQVCPTGSLMIAERTLTRWAFALDRCIFCGDCVEVCPHGALGITPNFELSFFHRFGEDITLEKNDLANAPNYLVRQRLPRSLKNVPVLNPLVRPLPPRTLRE